jgi:TPR repeat protein
LKWYHLAAEQGYPNAQHNIGYMYDTGEGVEQDYKEALKWYTLAGNITI